MIRFEHVGVTYPGSVRPALRDVSVTIGEGELCLVVGPTGAGKSTLLLAACGLVPHFTGGLLTGRVTVAGRDTRENLPRDLADVVGVVVQDPAHGFVTDTVEEELAYGMEQLGVSHGVMRQRVEEAMDLLDLVPLRTRPLADLSGGEQQRVAIGAVLTNHPRVLVLDEPTSALDPAAAEEVLSALTRLVHDLGMTVLLAEHRLERIVQHADHVVLVRADGSVEDGAPEVILARSPVAPPIVELGRLAGWQPVPLSVRDARRRAEPLRSALAGSPLLRVRQDAPDPVGPARTPAVAARGPLLSAVGLHVRYGRTHAVRGIDLTLGAGEVAAVMGRNGAGKSSLLWALQGAGPRSAGSVRVAPGAGDTTPAADPASLRPREARRRVALVPQNPQDLLYLPSVGQECHAADAQSGAAAGATKALLDRLAGSDAIDGQANPRDLSEGQRLTVVLLLDEPTRGLDYATKRRLTTILAEHAAAGGAVLLSSHDVEFVAECATRVVVLADGEVVTDAGVHEVLAASPVFAPQVAKILHPLELLTVAAVRAALAVPA